MSRGCSSLATVGSANSNYPSPSSSDNFRLCRRLCCVRLSSMMGLESDAREPYTAMIQPLLPAIDLDVKKEVGEDGFYAGAGHQTLYKLDARLVTF